MIHFEWDEAKNRINKIKHGVSFEEFVLSPQGGPPSERLKAIMAEKE